MMAKPIFIIKWPLREIDALKEAAKNIALVLDDYHTLFVPTHVKSVEFECYNVQNVAEMDLSELQEKVMAMTEESIKKHHESLQQNLS